MAVYPRLTGGPPAKERKRFDTLLDFAPDGACHSGDVAIAEVGSYPAFSPLPDHPTTKTHKKSLYYKQKRLCVLVVGWSGGIFSVALSVLTARPLNKWSGGQSRVLPGIMPCGARTFLKAIPAGYGQAAVWFIAIFHSTWRTAIGSSP